MKKNVLTKAALAASFLLCQVFFSVAYAYDVTVAKDGSGNYTSVQAAIDAAPTGRVVAYTIFIKNGTYKEKINIPSNKPFLQFIGESVANTILTYDDYSGKPLPGGGGTYGTSTSASVTINATDFAAVNITFENTTGESPQALAINVNGDRAAFKNCRFLGGQDTLLTNTNGMRNYFKNCYIDGTVDFIFGSARAVFDSCVIYAKTRAAAGNSYITAANTKQTEPYGYVFRNCKIPANRGTSLYYLGRPWQNDASTPDTSKSYNKVVFLNTKMSSTVRADGWSTWDVGTDVAKITFAEYKTQKMDGTLLDVGQRVAWAKQLSDTQAATYSNTNLFGTWDPCTVAIDFCTYQPGAIAVSNFKGVKGATVSVFTWNISWPMTGIKYEVMKSSDKVSFAIINTSTSTDDSSMNFTCTDTVPPPGLTYYYIVKASKIGLATHVPDTVAISSTPTITTTGTLGVFLQSVGTPSAVQTYNVSASNLTGNLAITAPTSFEVSTNGSIWATSPLPITLTPTGGNIANTLIYARLNAAAAGPYSGNIVHTATGAATINLAVNGAVLSGPLYTAYALQQWPMRLNNSDSGTSSAVVTATTPTLKNLYVSNGTTLATVPAYAPAYGQSFGASTNGDGTWSTGVGGPGGNLSRGHYEQFTITANNASDVRIDSILFQTSVYLTTANIKMAVAYSVSGFVNDSAEIAAGTGPGGSLTLQNDPIGVSPVFAKSFAITRNDAGPSAATAYALAFNNGATGINLSPGQTLTIRLYWSCGSTGTPRYASLKNVVVKGTWATTLPIKLLSFHAAAEAAMVRLTWATAHEENAEVFVVERSRDGSIFAPLGNLKANNATGEKSYSFNDMSPLAPLSFYRLKLVDKDGTFTYGPIITVNRASLFEVTAYPNPAKNTLTLTHPKAKAGDRIAVMGIEGKVLQRAQVPVAANQTKIDVSKLANGTYMAVYTCEGRSTSIKFTKQ